MHPAGDQTGALGGKMNDPFAEGGNGTTATTDPAGIDP